ncbi:MAG TPA: hypothetical protein VNO30_08430 [Kofleriaceae bacterium]|nr:hypothetical protein [Kofleriaceae bacterium]
MSEGERTEQADPDDPDDLADAPFIDDPERAEAAWLLARENDPGAPAPSPELARAHAELGDLLGDLPIGAPDQSWQAEVLRQATAAAEASPQPQPQSKSQAQSQPPPQSKSQAQSQPPPPPRRRIYRWAIAGSLAAAAAAVAMVILIPGSRPRADELEISIRHGDPARGDAQAAAVGDQLIIRARPHGPGELRVYRADGALLARCPGGPGCLTSANGEYALEVRLDAPVQHHVILVVGAVGDRSGQTMDAHLEAARAANARIVTHSIDVR